MKRTVVLLAAIVVVAAVGLALLLANKDDTSTDKQSRPGARETTPGDIATATPPDATPKDREPKTPAPGDLADIESAAVRSEGNEIVFEALMGSEVPVELKNQSMSWRWEIRQEDTTAWILSASLDIGPNATIFNPRTNEGGGTVDGSFPGEIERNGNSLIVRMVPSKLPSFPDDFEWRLTTRLVGRETDGGEVAEDSAPENGFGRFTGD